MVVYLLRHGIAEDAGIGKSDYGRTLTEDGRRKLRQVLTAAAEAHVMPSVVLSSPLVRTLQTAEIAAEVLHFKGDPLQTPVLKPGTTPDQVWEEIRLFRSEPSLLLVGHNPLMSELAGYLLGSPNMQIDFKKGALMKIQLDSFPSSCPSGSLHWYLTAKLASHRSV